MGKIKTNKNERRGLTDDILAIDSEVRQKNRKAKIASLSRQDEDDKVTFHALLTFWKSLFQYFCFFFRENMSTFFDFNF